MTGHNSGWEGAMINFFTHWVLKLSMRCNSWHHKIIGSKVANFEKNVMV